ncbi:Mitogen-activated protein kinase kinase kinase 2 [Diplonema papillatum]|nr:Mitogen-activated protein kinase kinase kinase 2 [Diplonema papillatum]
MGCSESKPAPRNAKNTARTSQAAARPQGQGGHVNGTGSQNGLKEPGATPKATLNGVTKQPSNRTSVGSTSPKHAATTGNSVSPGPSLLNLNRDAGSLLGGSTSTRAGRTEPQLIVPPGYQRKPSVMSQSERLSDASCSPVTRKQTPPVIEDEFDDDTDGSEGIRVASPNTTYETFMNNPTAEADRMLIQAVDDGQEDLVIQLLNEGRSPNGLDTYGYTPLHKAVVRREPVYANITRSLIKFGADVNALDGWDGRPLHAAVRQRNILAVKELLTGMPMADPLGGGGKDLLFTPVHEASERGNEEILELLLQVCGTNRETFLKTTKDGETVFHLAAKKGRTKCVELLGKRMRKLGISLDVSVQDGSGNTAFHLAASGGFKETMSKLEELGADKDAVNRNGHSVASYLQVPEKAAKRTGAPARASNLNSGNASSPPSARKASTGANSARGAVKPLFSNPQPVKRSATSGGGKKPKAGGKGKKKAAARKKSHDDTDTSTVASPAASSQKATFPHVTSPLSSPTSNTSTATATTNGKINPSDLQFWQRGKLLGKGAFGSVCEGLMSNGMLLAVKLVDFNPDDQKEAELVQMEFELIKNLQHKNILQYFGIVLGSGQLQIFMELAPNGSVASLVKRIGDALSIHVIRNFTKQILAGLAYLHDHGVIHRDIKGDNMLIGEGNVIKLCDFGSSRQFSNYMTADKCNTLIGTPLWMAPEVINLNGTAGYNSKADIWSVGITQIEMLNCVPWKDATSETPWGMMFLIGSTNKPPDGIPADCHPTLLAFMLRCFDRDAEKRPAADELLQDRFLTCPEDELERCI